MNRKLLLTTCTFLGASISFHGLADVAETVTFLADDANKNKVLQSEFGYCHPKESMFRASVKIKDDKSNVHNTIKECIEKGGKIPDHLKAEMDPYFRAEMEKTAQKALQDAHFGGFNWGAGFAFTHMGSEVVKDVSIEGGIIRVNHSGKRSGVLLLESHYYGSYWGENDQYGQGPFVAIGLVGQDGIDPLTTYGGGWMWGGKLEGGNAFNVGLGIFVDTDSLQLRDGLKDGDPTTITDPAKLTHKTDEIGFMFMFSGNF